MPGRLVFSTTADGASSPSERLRIDSSGRVGIGTSSPGSMLEVSKSEPGGLVQQKLLNTSTSANSNSNNFIYVNGAAAGDPFTTWTVGGVTSWSMGIDNSDSDKLVINNGSNLNSSLIAIDTSGNVGIGDDSPTVKLELVGSTTSALRIKSNSGSTRGFEFWNNSPANEAYISNYYSGPIVFQTNNTERLRIDSSGRLLVGATSGIYDFEVKKSGHIHGLIGSTNAAGATLLLDGDSNGDGSGSDYASISHNSDGALIFENRKSASIIFRNTSSSTERMRITSAGVVTVKNGAVAEIDTLTSASTVTPDFAASCNFTLTLGTNVTLANPSNVTAGQSGSIFLVQDGTGSRTLTLGSNYDFAGGTAPTLSTAANAVDRLDYIVRTSTSIHCVVTALYS